MRLTNYMRDAFLRSAMNDVPQVDHDALIRKAALAAALKNLPPKVRAIYDDEKIRVHLETTHVSFRPSGISVTVPGARSDEHVAAVQKACEILCAAAVDQRNRLKELNSKLRAVAYGMSTRKALADALPEFAKYLPADEPAAIKTLPVVANVVTDFVKAGWPKGKKVSA